jgi:hypothetical protein
MGGGQLLPFCWRQATAASTCRTMSTRTILAQTKILLLGGGRKQRYSSNGSDGSVPSDNNDDVVREQKTAFLRAVEGTSGNKSLDTKEKNRHNKVNTKSNKTNNEMAVGKQKKKNHATAATATRRRPNHQRQYNNNNNNNDNSHRRRNNGKDAQNSSTKKLTLDEFFANLDKTGESSEPTAIKTTQNESYNENKRRHRHDNNNNNNNNKSHSNNENKLGVVREVPVADMGSFFDEVDALMKRKQEENQETVGNRSKALTSMSTSTSFSSTKNNKTPAYTSIHRPSILDILPPPQDLSEKDHNNDSRRHNYDVESWDQYVELIEEIMEGPNFLKKFKKIKRNKSTSQHQQTSPPTSPYNDETTNRIHQVVDWLRSPKPVVEPHLPTLHSSLRGENEETVIESSNNNDHDQASAHDDNESNNAIDTTTMIGMNTFRSERFREELNAQRERFINEMGWTRKQYEVANGALVYLGSICAKTCAAKPLDVAWSKLKETGYPMNNKDVLHNYLYVSSTFSLPKRKTMMSSSTTSNSGLFGDNDGFMGDEGVDGRNKSSFSVLDFLNETRSSNNYNSAIHDNDEEEEIDVSAEVALCHDFLHEATEQSTGIHVRRLVSLGKANEAERLLDATMVRI